MSDFYTLQAYVHSRDLKTWRWRNCDRYDTLDEAENAVPCSTQKFFRIIHKGKEVQRWKTILMTNE